MFTALMLSAVLGQAAPEPYYEDRELRLNIPGAKLDAQTLRAALAEQLLGRVKRVYVESADGIRAPIAPSRVDPASARAALVVLTHGAIGAEADLLVKDLEGSWIPVTVTWESKKILVLRRGEPLRDAAVAGLSRKSVRERWQLGALVNVDRSWNAPALALLNEAVSRLSDDERERIVGMSFHRVSHPSDAVRSGVLAQVEGKLAAAYTVGETGARIEVYDTAIDTPVKFIGDPEAPQPAALGVLLHEMGHAISWADHRQGLDDLLELRDRHEAMVKQLVADQAQFNARVLAFNAAGAGGDRAALHAEKERIEARVDENRALVTQLESKRHLGNAPENSTATVALQQLLHGRQAPTSYGRVHPEEAFAECFALYHADRRALERLLPDVVRWFDAGRHLE